MPALPRKMSAKRDEMTTRNPKSMSAHTACSRDEPVPKSGPATNTEPLSKGAQIENEGRIVAPRREQTVLETRSGDPLQIDRRE